jgi:hypothetical protein
MTQKEEKHLEQDMVVIKILGLNGKQNIGRVSFGVPNL